MQRREIQSLERLEQLRKGIEDLLEIYKKEAQKIEVEWGRVFRNGSKRVN